MSRTYDAHACKCKPQRRRRRPTSCNNSQQPATTAIRKETHTSLRDMYKPEVLLYVRLIIRKYSSLSSPCIVSDDEAFLFRQGWILLCHYYQGSRILRSTYVRRPWILQWRSKVKRRNHLGYLPTWFPMETTSGYIIQLVKRNNLDIPY